MSKPPLRPTDQTAPSAAPSAAPLESAAASVAANASAFASTPAFAHPLRAASLSSRKPTRFALAPGGAVRAGIAPGLDLLSLPALTFKGEVRPTGARDFVLEARLEATVVQACGLTLAPVKTRIAEDVTRRYVADWVDPTGDEAEMPADDTSEPMPEMIDAAAVALEALALALPQYPRAPGAAFAPVAAAPEGVAPLQDGDLKPFAGLAALRARLGGDPEG